MKRLGTVVSGIALGALGAHLFGHSPSMAQAAPSAAPAHQQSAIRIDAGGGALAFLVESHELPLVDVTIALRSGSALDPEAKVGLARFLVRMLRRGAPSWDAEKIAEAIDRLGAELSVDASPSTITIHAQVIRRNLEPFVKLLSEIVAHPTFPEDEVARLRRETLAEIVEARDSDSALARRFFRKSIFGAHPYGRGTTGTTTTVKAIERADVLAAHKQHFVRGNVLLAIAGDLTEAEARAIVLPMLDKLPAGKANVDATPEPKVQKGRRLTFVDKPSRTQTQILIGGLGTLPSDADHIALHVGNTVFGGTFTARLMKAVRSDRGWSYGAYSRLPVERRRESFSMWTFPAATDAAPCIALELELLEKLVKEGISDKELSFAKSYLGESYAFDIDTPSKRVHQAIDEELFGLPADYHTRYVEHVRGVTLAQANAALASRLSADDLTIVVVGTASEIKDGVVKAIPRLGSVEVVPFDSE